MAMFEYFASSLMCVSTHKTPLILNEMCDFLLILHNTKINPQMIYTNMKSYLDIPYQHFSFAFERAFHCNNLIDWTPKSCN